MAAFGEGTDKGAPQRAKPEVWKDGAKFKAAGEKMVAEMAKLDAAVKGGNLDAIKAAFGPVGGSCKACHDDFRAEKYSTN
jgi:cytochrome c556